MIIPAAAEICPHYVRDFKSGNLLTDDDAFCVKCVANVRRLIQSPVQEEISCGQKMYADSKFCPKCGAVVRPLL